MVICEQIRKVKNGYIVVVRAPYGDSTVGCGEAVCKSFKEVVSLLERAANEDELSRKLHQAGMRGLVPDENLIEAGDEPTAEVKLEMLLSLLRSGGHEITWHPAHEGGNVGPAHWELGCPWRPPTEPRYVTVPIPLGTSGGGVVAGNLPVHETLRAAREDAEKRRPAAIYRLEEPK